MWRLEALLKVLVLPGVLRISQGRESLVVQGACRELKMLGDGAAKLEGAMMVHAFKFIGYAWAPNGKWLYAVLVTALPSFGSIDSLANFCEPMVFPQALSTPTFCAAPVLSSFESQHSVLSHADRAHASISPRPVHETCAFHAAGPVALDLARARIAGLKAR